VIPRQRGWLVRLDWVELYRLTRARRMAAFASYRPEAAIPLPAKSSHLGAVGGTVRLGSNPASCTGTKRQMLTTSYFLADTESWGGMGLLPVIACRRRPRMPVKGVGRRVGIRQGHTDGHTGRRYSRIPLGVGWRGFEART